MLEYDVMTVAQLKHELQQRGLPVSGRKAELLARLQSEKPADIILSQVVLEAEIDPVSAATPWRRGYETVIALPLPALIVIGLVITGSAGYAGYELVSAFLDEEVEYQDLIDFDSTRARGYAQCLI